MKVEFEAYFDGKDIQIVNKPFIIEQLSEKFKPGYLDGSVQTPWMWKTSEAMGYFWGEVAVKAALGLKESGYEVPSKESAVDFLMEQMPSGRWAEEVKRFGKPVKTSARSISSLSRAELHELTDEMIAFIAEWFGIACGSPEEYKMKHKLKSRQ